MLWSCFQEKEKRRKGERKFRQLSARALLAVQPGEHAHEEHNHHDGLIAQVTAEEREEEKRGGRG
jgi:hypothetical protein